MPHRSQSSSIGDNPLDPNYLAPHYREEYRLAIDALIENDTQADMAGFLAQPEIEHIKSTIQGPSQPTGVPELTYHEGGVEADGSSDTYWPVQSDLAAPGLDLGWPQHSFVDPTEVTTLVNPSDPDMPSIKEQARRLIKNARQVIAVVMDMFTDIDIFSDLLDAAARHVPVYILLDQLEAHHFVSMVLNCKVNLEFIPMIRVRTVAGIPYYTRTGKSFKGQVKDRFLLADCRAVLSGNYSFMWSYEKIHRCIAHLFLGELVATFDEEFRILYAQSEPLVIDPNNTALTVSDPSSTGNYLGSQFGLKRSQSLRNPVGYRRQPEIPPAFPYGDTDRNPVLPFRRNDAFRQTLEPGTGITIGKYSQQQFRLQQSFLEQGRSIVSRQMEMSASAFKRHSYAEGTQETYASSRQFMQQRLLSNKQYVLHFRYREQIQSSHFYSEGPGPGSGHGHFDRLRGRPPHLSIDQYSDSSYRSDQEPPPGQYGRDYFSSEDLRGPEGHNAPPLAGRYGGGSSHKRPTIGQAYACQSSPTHPHPPEKKHFNKQFDQEHEEDSSAKQGLRSWRIHSYLNTYEDTGEEGLAQPMGPDPRPDILRPRFGKPKLPESSGPELLLSKHESFRSRVNPLLQRSSRLRSSLIFSSSKAEIHSGSLGLKPATEEDEELDSVRTSSIVAQILEKRRSLSREPFDWRRKTEEKKEKEEKQEKLEKKEIRLKDEIKPKEEPKETNEKVKTTFTLEKPKVTDSSSLNMNDPASRLQYFKDLAAKTKVSKTETEPSLKALEPAEKRQDLSDKPPNITTTLKTPAVTLSTAEPEQTKPDISAKLAELNNRRPSVSSSRPPLIFPKPFISSQKPSEIVQSQKEENASEGQKKDLFKSLKPLHSPKIFKKEPVKLKGINPRRISCGEEILTTDATDAEKTEMKKSRSHSSSILSHEDSKEGLQRVMGSTTSINTIGEGKGEGKTLDFLKKQTQRLKGFLGPKDKEKKTSGEDRGMSTVIEVTDNSSKKQSSSSKDTASTAADQSTTNHKTSTTGTSVTSRYQPAGGSVLYSSNLRDDTKVILEQISANSQKNRQEREETGGNKDGDAGDKGTEKQNSLKRNRFLRPQGNNQEREGLLRRIESLRKEKKVYSRFEVVYHSKGDVCSVDGKAI
uniref:Family with sequence similarity 83 member Hb n=1 Tax=Neolamprologus brichardi TaxID=32507 RepID=A0A3Q4H0C5_NEOBR